MRIFNHDGHLYIVMTTGDIKDIRDCSDILTVNYFTEIKPLWYDRILQRLGLKRVIKPVRAISFTNEKSYERHISKGGNNGGKENPSSSV